MLVSVSVHYEPLCTNLYNLFLLASVSGIITETDKSGLNMIMSISSFFTETLMLLGTVANIPVSVSVLVSVSVGVNTTLQVE